jgi:hypothetical protein
VGSNGCHWVGNYPRYFRLNGNCRGLLTAVMFLETEGYSGARNQSKQVSRIMSLSSLSRSPAADFGY